MVGDPLDDYFESIKDADIRNLKRMLNVLREAYTCGVPALMAKSMMDRLKQAGGYSFYLGTPPDELRRIASFVLTRWSIHQRMLSNLLTALWKRHGREDTMLYGILLANIEPALVDDDVWGHLSDRLGVAEPADSLLAVCEELSRAGHPLPDETVLLDWSERSVIHHQLAVFILFMRSRCGEGLSKAERGMVEACPEGSELAARVRDRLLRA